MRTVEDMGGNIVLINATMDGVAALRNDFTTELIRDKGLLVSAEFIDNFRAASDSFQPGKVMEVRSRKAEFTQGDIDIKLTNSDIQKAYRSYLGWIMEPTRTEAEVRDNPFELFHIRQIIAQHFQFARTKTSWKGVYNPTPQGAENIADGYIKKLATGRTAGGDIKASHVFTSAATITDANCYEQVLGLAQKLVDEREDLLNIPLNLYLSQRNYDRYKKGRRAAFPEFVGPGEKPTTLDDQTNISFVIDSGLVGKDTMVITPKQNLKFIADEAPGSYYINIVRAVKHWELSIRVSIGFDYASPDLVFLNDKV